jgi:uncharacterized protein (TIGR02117 family)
MRFFEPVKQFGGYLCCPLIYYSCGMNRFYFVLKIIWRCIYIPLECITGLLVVFWCGAAILSRIGVPAEEVPAAEKVHTVYITSSGVHCDIVLPVRDSLMDWTRELQLPDSLAKDTARPCLGFGWGNKQFFIETKSWSDLKVSVFLRATFHLGNSALHIVQVPEPDTANPQTIRLLLTDDQYRRLIGFIKNEFTVGKGGYEPIPEHPYGSYNYFFEAKRSYGLLYTCNSWTNKALKVAGQKACVWTAFKDGIYLQYRK